MKDAWQFLLISGRHLPFAPHDSILKVNTCNHNSQKMLFFKLFRMSTSTVDTMEMTSGPRSSIGCVIVHINYLIGKALSYIKQKMICQTL